MARRKQETLVLFPDLFTAAKKLNDTQFGALMRALGAYRFDQEEYAGEDLVVGMAFDFVKAQVDRYTQTCQTNRENREENSVTNSVMEDDVVEESTTEYTECNEMQGNATESQECTEMQKNPTHTHTHNHTHSHKKEKSVKEKTADKPPTPTRFSAPTVEEVKQYCDSTGLSLDVQRFVDYYTSNGWKVGKASMKDWKAAARNWNRVNRLETQPEEIPRWTIGVCM